MTPRSRPFRFREAAIALLLGAVAACPRQAAAQACCAGGAVVTPSRLALHEDFAVGMQLRARTNPGSFDAGGHYATSSGVEQIFEQDVAVSARLGAKGQIGLLMPTVQTHRDAGALDDWGGGLGDASLTGRYDVLLPTQALDWPGLGVLAAATLPTGTPPDRASHPLAADATGAGTYDVTLGVDVAKVTGHVYAALDGWLTHRFARTLSVGNAMPLTEAFSVRWTLMGVVDYVFDSEAALGLYVSTFNEGPGTINGVRDPTTQRCDSRRGGRGRGLLPIGDLVAAARLDLHGRPALVVRPERARRPRRDGGPRPGVAVKPRQPVVAVQIVAVLLVSALAFAAPPRTPDLSDIVLDQGAGAIELRELVRQHRFTAIVFFSATCPCFDAHRARLAALVHEMERKDVRIVIVDSERRHAGEAAVRLVPATDLPILQDRGGTLARRLDAAYATETYVFDASGSLRYRGGIDDDRRTLSQKPRAHLRDALLGLLAGTAPAYATSKTLGCGLAVAVTALVTRDIDA